MNFQCEPILESIKVILVNPLGPAAQLVIVKILSGAVFGDYQMVDLSLLVYANEITSAEELKLEIESCAFSCYNTIEITSDLPRSETSGFFRRLSKQCMAHRSRCEIAAATVARRFVFKAK